ncbi:unnamed protein product [Lymnaea stagnalis]|uniref:Uncharacterized protein n=1 Tax=Lymnaea stagnalis TaxID=6523 RepID=A0AAV2H4E2_LYMST
MLKGLLKSLLFVIMLNVAIARDSHERWGHSMEHGFKTDEGWMNPGQGFNGCNCPKVNHHLPIIIGSVLGAVIVALLVVIITLIVLLKRRSSVQTPVPAMVSNAMYPDPEKKAIMTMDYPPLYADVMKTAPALSPKKDLLV